MYSVPPVDYILNFIIHTFFIFFLTYISVLYHVARLHLFTHVILLGDGDKLQGMEIKWQPCKVLWVTSVRDSVSWV